MYIMYAHLACINTPLLNLLYTYVRMYNIITTAFTVFTVFVYIYHDHVQFKKNFTASWYISSHNNNDHNVSIMQQYRAIHGVL